MVEKLEKEPFNAEIFEDINNIFEEYSKTIKSQKQILKAQTDSENSDEFRKLSVDKRRLVLDAYISQSSLLEVTRNGILTDADILFKEYLDDKLTTEGNIEDLLDTVISWCSVNISSDLLESRELAVDINNIPSELVESLLTTSGRVVEILRAATTLLDENDSQFTKDEIKEHNRVIKNFRMSLIEASKSDSSDVLGKIIALLISHNVLTSKK